MKIDATLIEYERLRKICDKYSIDIDICENGITLSPKKSPSVGIYDLNEFNIYLIGYAHGIHSCRQE